MVLHPKGVHPELRAVARILPPGYGLARSLTLPRTAMRLLARAGADHDTLVAAVTPDITVRLHHPAALTEPAPALLWIHGGGYVMGSAGQEDRYCRRLSHLASVAVAAVEHRLAPENPYPAALDDCYAALTWLAGQSWVDATRIAVGGASAGGGLAAALALRARDRGEVQPIAQLLAYPMLDDRTGAAPDDRARMMWSASEINTPGGHTWPASTPRSPSPADMPTSATCQRRGSASAPWICSPTNAVPTVSGYVRRAHRATPRLPRSPFMPST
jgi:acetyl esterase/lipase